MKNTTRTFHTFIPWIFVIIWASGTFFAEAGVHYTDPFTFLLYRYLFAMIILWGICLKLKTKLPSSRQQWQSILTAGLFQQISYQAFFFLALAQHVSPGILSIILGAQPILTTILTQRNTTRMQWMGLIAGLVGLILVVMDSIVDGNFSIIGITCCLLAMLSITIGTILQKKINVPLPANMAVQYTTSFIAFLVIAPIAGSLQVEWTIGFFISMFYMVIIITVGATMLLYYMVRQGNLMNVTSLFYCVPPLTALFDYFIFGHALTIYAAIGLLLVVTGLVMINKKST